ncbi:hypothetical protein BBP40_008751 [Aspergillus hancockii]|nr:hypothetical protein BBP40_008751 [Aspergillus hancockii]
MEVVQDLAEPDIYPDLCLPTDRPGQEGVEDRKARFERLLDSVSYGTFPLTHLLQHMAKSEKKYGGKIIWDPRFALGDIPEEFETAIVSRKTAGEVLTKSIDKMILAHSLGDPDKMKLKKSRRGEEPNQYTVFEVHYEGQRARLAQRWGEITNLIYRKIGPEEVIEEEEFEPGETEVAYLEDIIPVQGVDPVKLKEDTWGMDESEIKVIPRGGSSPSTWRCLLES